jgi:hypothetical protein
MMRCVSPNKGKRMKIRIKILTLIVSILLVGIVLFAQTTGDTSTVLGKVHAVNGKSLDLLIPGSTIRKGETLYILQDSKPVSKLQVTELYHTKVKAKVVTTTVTIEKGMSFGRWKEGAKVVEEKETLPVKSSGEFSDYQGYLNWENAKAKCDSLKMRLPTKDELEAAYKAGVTESWKNDGYTYWSSTTYGDDYAYYINVTLGFSYSYSRNTYDNVRCIR